MTWDKQHFRLQNQLYVFAKQHHRVWRLKNQVDVIISDSPLIMNLAYAEGMPDCYRELVKHAHNEYFSLNYLVNGDKPYNPKGRNQSEEEAAEKHAEIVRLMEEFGVPYRTIAGTEADLDSVVDDIERILLAQQAGVFENVIPVF